MQYSAYLNACYSQCCFNVLGHSEGNFLWDPQSLPLLKAHIVVNMNNLKMIKKKISVTAFKLLNTYLIRTPSIYTVNV